MAKLITSDCYGVKSNSRGYIKPKVDPNDPTWEDLYRQVPPANSHSSGNIKSMNGERINERQST